MTFNSFVWKFPNMIVKYSKIFQEEIIDRESIIKSQLTIYCYINRQIGYKHSEMNKSKIQNFSRKWKKI